MKMLRPTELVLGIGYFLQGAVNFLGVQEIFLEIYIRDGPPNADSVDWLRNMQSSSRSMQGIV
jgi:hypothetical protein